MDPMEEVKQRIRDMILLNGNRMDYHTIIQTFPDNRDILDDILHEMFKDGDFYEPKLGIYAVVV